MSDTVIEWNLTHIMCLQVALTVVYNHDLMSNVSTMESICGHTYCSPKKEYLIKVSQEKITYHVHCPRSVVTTSPNKCCTMMLYTAINCSLSSWVLDTQSCVSNLEFSINRAVSLETKMWRRRVSCWFPYTCTYTHVYRYTYRYTYL